MEAASRRIVFALSLVLAVLLLAGEALAADNYNPQGTDDRADCSRLAGWARDRDTIFPIQVHIYKGAPYPEGTYVTALYAGLFRSDLPFPDKHHGYSIATPSAFKTGCPEKVYVYGIDTDSEGENVPNGANKLLNGTGSTIQCGTPPPACLEEPPELPEPPGPIDQGCEDDL